MIKKHAIVKFKDDSGETLQGLVDSVGIKTVTIKIPNKKTKGEQWWVVNKEFLLEVWQ